MKQHVFIAVLLLFLPASLFSQTFLGNYDFIDNQITNPSLASTKKYSLIINNTNSLFTLIDDKLKENYPTEKSDLGNNVSMEKISDDYARILSNQKTVFYRNYITNEISYNTLILNKEVYIDDKINFFDWKYKLEPIIYNNLNCSVATVNHRGRDWTVYYTLEIPFQGGPWKFSGLPGMIVYAKSDDGNFIFELTDYKIDKENVNIQNPFFNQKTLTWEEYKSTYYKSFKNLIKKLNSKDEDGGETKITFNDLLEDIGFTEIK